MILSLVVFDSRAGMQHVLEWRHGHIELWDHTVERVLNDFVDVAMLDGVQIVDVRDNMPAVVVAQLKVRWQGLEVPTVRPDLNV